MAKLSVSDAARVAGVARSTLHRALRAGRLSADPDGTIDTAELLRAGYTLQRSTLQTHAPSLQDATPRPRHTHQDASPAPQHVLEALTHERDLLRMERDLLRQTLEAAREHAQDAKEREQEARAREALLLRMLEQVQQQNQRLLDVGRSPAPASGESASRDARPPRDASRPRGEMRQRIVALLQAHPEGLSPAETRRRLASDKKLVSTMKAMARDGLLRRVTTGWYVAAEALR